jgi:hypothetical protein
MSKYFLRFITSPGVSGAAAQFYSKKEREEASTPVFAAKNEQIEVEELQLPSPR